MTRNSARACVWVAFAVALAGPAVGQDGKPVAVDPGELTRRPDLVGREVEVDDRLGRFQFHRETGFDQVYLKRAPDVAFELPPRLRTPQAPRASAVRLRGVLRHEGDRWWCDVSSLETLPSDLDRLNRAVALLSRSDLDARLGWAAWGERRGREFHDEALTARAREVMGEVIRAEAEKPPGRDPAAQWLRLAERARAAHVAEPEPSAQAHRGFRAALAASRSADDLKGLVGRIEAFFPAADRPADAPADLAGLEKGYQKAPADAYRAATPAARAALDRRLWADATEQLLRRRAADDPKALLGLAEEAARLLPDRPGVALGFLEKGAESASGDVGALRQSEVDALARLYRETLHQPEKARALYRAWLDDQKDHRLSVRDAEGRIALAEQYETLLDDRATAVSLLRDAWKIDPQSREVTDAFRRRRFRKVRDEWVAPQEGPGSSAPPEVARAAEPGTPPAPAQAATAGRSGDDSLRNATPEVVRARFGGKPNRTTRVASQGQLIEQWVYLEPRKVYYVNILHKTGDPHPRVVSFFALSRSPSDASPAP